VISVIVTLFEQIETLTILLECLENQVYFNGLEVLISDDGSKSGVSQVVQNAASRGRLEIKYIWQQNLGFRAGTARNNAIKIAKGDILIFLDGDMLVPPDFVSQHASRHDGRPLLVCGTRSTCIADGNLDLASLYRNGELTMLNDVETKSQCAWAQSSTPWMALLSCNFSVIRRPEVLFDENFLGWGYEDREFAYRLVQQHCYDLQLSRGARAVHIWPASGVDYWNPLHNNNCRQEAIVNLVRNALYFVDLYPDADVTPALNLLRRYHIDASTDEWYVDAEHLESNIDTLVNAARKWFGRHGVELLSAARIV
jgi:glycosyltransferase involved in cell wall biosynthesis